MSKMKQDPAPYAEMKRAGASAEDVFLAAHAHGFKNFECVALICGLFDISLEAARGIAHKAYGEKLQSDLSFPVRMKL